LTVVQKSYFLAKRRKTEEWREFSNSKHYPCKKFKNPPYRYVRQ
jgi:hypothetical protein